MNNSKMKHAFNHRYVVVKTLVRQFGVISLEHYSFLFGPIFLIINQVSSATTTNFDRLSSVMFYDINPFVARWQPNEITVF